MALKDLPPTDRPRERAARLGLCSLTDVELLALLIGSGYREYSAIGLANRLLEKSGSLGNLARLAPEHFGLKGLGPVRSTLIAAAFELGRRAAVSPAAAPEEVGSSRFFIRYHHRFYGLFHERFLLILLDRNLQPLVDNFVDSDNRSRLAISFARLLKLAASVEAPYAVVMHNHPSGDSTPSAADDEATSAVGEALRLIEVELFDHLVVTESGYYSYRDRGRLKTCRSRKNST